MGRRDRWKHGDSLLRMISDWLLFAHEASFGFFGIDRKMLIPLSRVASVENFVLWKTWGRIYQTASQQC